MTSKKKYMTSIKKYLSSFIAANIKHLPDKPIIPEGPYPIPSIPPSLPPIVPLPEKPYPTPILPRIPPIPEVEYDYKENYWLDLIFETMLKIFKILREYSKILREYAKMLMEYLYYYVLRFLFFLNFNIDFALFVMALLKNMRFTIFLNFVNYLKLLISIYIAIYLYDKFDLKFKKYLNLENTATIKIIENVSIISAFLILNKYKISGSNLEKRGIGWIYWIMNSQNAQSNFLLLTHLYLFVYKDMKKLVYTLIGDQNKNKEKEDDKDQKDDKKRSMLIKFFKNYFPIIFKNCLILVISYLYIIILAIHLHGIFGLSNKNPFFTKYYISPNAPFYYDTNDFLNDFIKDCQKLFKS